MINSVYGKTIENMRKRMKIRIVIHQDQHLIIQLSMVQILLQ